MVVSGEIGGVYQCIVKRKLFSAIVSKRELLPPLVPFGSLVSTAAPVASRGNCRSYTTGRPRMVVSKEGKRRRKVSAIAQAGGGSSNPSSGSSGANGPSIATVAAERDLSPPEIPKRPKVHAQRKFAQGQGTASSSYLSYSSAPPTPGKDGANRASHSGTGNGTTPTVPGSGTGSETNPSQVPELLPNMRPNTEDFLTFLCFRGTPVLPPALDFFNKTNSTAGNSSGSGGRHSSAAGGSGSSKLKAQQQSRTA
uniref:Uncharacterized protein n=1 Tax=Anopheles maculatus TaxID=74869 RepID=A0A182S6Z2_9DIPT